MAYYSGAGEETGFGQVFLIPQPAAWSSSFATRRSRAGSIRPSPRTAAACSLWACPTLKVKKEKGSELSFATMSLSLADLNGGALRQIISHANTRLDTGYIYSNPAFSPDGRLIAYQESGSDVSGGFVVINLQGKRIFRFPRNSRDATPYWRPQFSPDGKEILCYSPATNPGDADVIYLVDLASGKKTTVTLGSKPTYVDHGKAMVYERWPKERWTAKTPVKADLWRLELTPGAQPQKIMADAEEPAGQMP